jgi:small subunit ribosomal protein S16
MLKIRLKRVGRKHDPSYRLVVLESRRGPKSGDYIENLGSYNTRTDEKKVNAERVNHWISVGAKPSDTAHNLLVELGVITGKKVNVLPKKSPVTKDDSQTTVTGTASPKDTKGVDTEKSELDKETKEKEPSSTGEEELKKSEE